MNADDLRTMDTEVSVLASINQKLNLLIPLHDEIKEHKSRVDLNLLTTTSHQLKKLTVHLQSSVKTLTIQLKLSPRKTKHWEKLSWTYKHEV